MEKFKMKLRSFSFRYADFKQLTGLVYDGDIRLDQGTNVLRVTSTKNLSKSGCVWHSLKQRIDLGFKTTFAFKFVNPLAPANKGGVNQSMISGSALGGTPRNPSTVLEDKGGKRYEAAVAFVIQNEKEVIPWKQKTPMSTTDLNQFIAIKFVTRVSSGGPSAKLGGGQLKTSAQLAHFVQVVASAETNIGKIRNIVDEGHLKNAQNKTEVVLAEEEITNDEISFMDSQFHQVILEYNKDSEELKISFAGKEPVV